MRLTKLGHACVRLEKDGQWLVIDPGVWAGEGALAGADAVLVTHEHPDHLDAEAIGTALRGNPGLQVWTNASAAAMLAEFSSQVHTVAHGDTFTAVGFDVHVYGSEHAAILPGVPLIANTGYAVDGQVFHPGDALTVPEERVGTLMLPVSAPWLKFAEAAAYAKEVAPDRGYAIHDAILSANGLGLIDMLLKGLSGQGTPLVRLEPGTSVDL
jgi:L-ascorbate metabolism protein UlaG (beta-lactamase superfamily)